MYGMFSYEYLHPSARSGGSRLTEIDRAKGLAILLVVVGHLVAGDPPKGNAWFEQLVTIIYSFHMPFFMYLSGFVMLYTFRGLDTKRSYLDYSFGKFKRLAPGFFCFAIIILTGKLLASQVVHVDYQSTCMLQGVFFIVLTHGQSAAK
jgi:fucose 4-O-acetylase-like acetyltransferase